MKNELTTTRNKGNLEEKNKDMVTYKLLEHKHLHL